MAGGKAFKQQMEFTAKGSSVNRFNYSVQWGPELWGDIRGVGPAELLSKSAHRDMMGQIASFHAVISLQFQNSLRIPRVGQ